MQLLWLQAIAIFRTKSNESNIASESFQMSLAKPVLVAALDRYVRAIQWGSVPAKLESEIRSIALVEDDASVFKQIVPELWDRYFCVDVELMIVILRRWLEVDSESCEAKHVLGSYLLAHGPDWDEEGERLFDEAKNGRCGSPQNERE